MGVHPPQNGGIGHGALARTHLPGELRILPRSFFSGEGPKLTQRFKQSMGQPAEKVENLGPANGFYSYLRSLLVAAGKGEPGA